jgi:hypothetical protein
MEEKYEIMKTSLLEHMREVLEEIEEGIARSHEEKYALLEDALESSSDIDELKVAFDQWYNDHYEDLDLEYEIDELWDAAAGRSGSDF